jgi:hypothetical protein
MLDFEIEKYRRLGRREIVEWYERDRRELPAHDVLAAKLAAITRALEQDRP